MVNPCAAVRVPCLQSWQTPPLLPQVTYARSPQTLRRLCRKTTQAIARLTWGTFPSPPFLQPFLQPSPQPL